jgi:hypothetical protein
MNKSEYHKYLKSSKWKEVSRLIKVRDKWTCRLCNSGLDLNVHHRSYKYIGRESESLIDLITLCQRCHSLFHATEPLFPESPKPKAGKKKGKAKADSWTKSKLGRQTKVHAKLNKRRDSFENEFRGIDSFLMSAERLELIQTFSYGLTDIASAFIGVNNKSKGWKNETIGKMYECKRFIVLMEASRLRERSHLGAEVLRDKP